MERGIGNEGEQLSLREFTKRLIWPGPDYGTRIRYGLRRRFLRGQNISTLDVGCGNGCMTIAAAERGGSALGISLQGDALARARQVCQRLGMSPTQCEFKEMNVYDLADSATGSSIPQFDQIILFEVLEHLYHDNLGLDACVKHLKTDGWVHITVPNRDSHWHFEGVNRFENGQHVRHGYTFEELEALLWRHGLEPIDRLGVGGLGTVWGFLAVIWTGKLLGDGGRVIAFLLTWPIVPLLNLIPCRPWSLYVLAAKREQRLNGS